MIRTIAFLLALVAAGPAMALTCVPPSIAITTQSALESPESFVIAVGALERTGPNVPNGPETGDLNNRVGYSFPARFTGRFAGTTRFGRPRTVQVTVEVRCVSAWCGIDGLSDNGLYFFQVGDGYRLLSGPCPFYLFLDPTPAQLQEVIRLLP